MYDDAGNPLVSCNGQGTCLQHPSGCRDGDVGCSALCSCSGNWTGADCSQTFEQLAAKQQIRSQMLDVLVRADWGELSIGVASALQGAMLRLCSRHSCYGLAVCPLLWAGQRVVRHRRQ